MNTLQQLYDSEINFLIQSRWVAAVVTFFVLLRIRRDW